MCRSHRVLVAVACVAACLITGSTGAAAAAAPFRPPVDRPVSRVFQSPDGPYGAGHRGLDYAVHTGDRVVAVGDGVVGFAGRGAGQSYVTVLHPNGLRSSYAYVTAIAVGRGQHVRAGAVLAQTTTRFLLTVRLGDTYLDPATLIGGVAPTRHAHLVRTRA